MSIIKTEVLVLHAGSYDFTNDRGEKIVGVKIQYSRSTVLTPRDVPARGNNIDKGYRVAEVSLPIGFVSKFIKVPGIYHLEEEADVNSKGQVIMKILDINFSSDFEIAKVADTDISFDIGNGSSKTGGKK